MESTKELEILQDTTTGSAACVSWKDLKVTASIKGKEKVILDGVRGFLGAGDLIAVMGPSGSGKTSLLQALSGRLRKSNKLEGEIEFGGAVISDEERRRILSFVMQEDALMGSFTVQETLNFSALFHYGFGLTREELDNVVQESIKSVGLTKAANTLVGDIFRKGLSGGQKRRLSIAIELLRKPSIIFLDEPTSGLDSTSAFRIVELLKEMTTKQSQAVMTTIHQPSSQVWALFDKFLLISEGHTMYFGSAAGAAAYFSNLGYPCPASYNPADYFIMVVNVDFTEDLAVLHQLKDSYKTSELYTKMIPSVASLPAANNTDSPQLRRSANAVSRFLANVVILSKRNIMNNVRNPGIYWVRFAMYTMLSLMIGFMYLDLGNSYDASDINSRMSALFYIAAFLVFMAVAVLPFFIQERAVFVREKMNGAYDIPEFVIANFICSLPGLFIIALFSTMAVILLTGMNGFGVFLMCLFLSLVAAESFMALVAAIVPHFIIGIALGAGVFGFFMLCEGFFIVKSDIPPWFIWGHYLAFHTYSFRVFMHNEFDPIESFDSPQFATGKAVLSFYDMDDVDVVNDLAILFAFALIFQVIFGLILAYRY